MVRKPPLASVGPVRSHSPSDAKAGHSVQVVWNLATMGPAFSAGTDSAKDSCSPPICEAHQVQRWAEQRRGAHAGRDWGGSWWGRGGSEAGRGGAGISSRAELRGRERAPTRLELRQAAKHLEVGRELRAQQEAVACFRLRGSCGRAIVRRDRNGTGGGGHRDGNGGQERWARRRFSLAWRSWSQALVQTGGLRRCGGQAVLPAGRGRID